MAFPDHGRFNWGCASSSILGAFIMPTLFGGLMIGGGGCEGRPSPCDGDFANVWIVMGLALTGLAIFAWLTNKLIAAIFRSGR